MVIRVRCVAVGAALLLAGCAGTTGVPDAHVGAAFFPAAIDGNVTITQGGLPGSGSRIDVQDDLALDGDSLGQLSLRLDDGPLRFRLDWLPFDFSGETRLDRDVVFHGRTFPSGARVESDLSLETWAGGIDAPLVAGDDFELRAGGGVYWWTLDMKVKETGGASESRQFSRLLPAATLSSHGALGGGFGLGFDGAFATIDKGRRLLDVAADVDWELDRFRAAFGWRWLRYWLNEDTNTGQLDLHGPTLELTLRL